MSTAAPSQSATRSAPAAHGCSCISRTVGRGAAWPRSVSAAGWVRRWCWSDLEPAMIEQPPDESAWIPTPEFIETTNMAWLMKRAGVDSYAALHAWSVQNREAFWAGAIERLGILFAQPYSQVADFSHGVEAPRWLVDARMNIVDSCFRAPAHSPAIIHQAEGGSLQTMTVGELEALTRRVAANLQRLGFAPGDAIAIIMPMTAECV